MYTYLFIYVYIYIFFSCNMSLHHLLAWYLCRPEDGIRYPGTEYSCKLPWVLGIELGSFAKVANARNWWASSPAPTLLLNSACSVHEGDFAVFVFLWIHNISPYRLICVTANDMTYPSLYLSLLYAWVVFCCLYVKWWTPMLSSSSAIVRNAVISTIL